MEVTNEEQNETPRLTQADLAIAAFALAETFNLYLERYEAEDFEIMNKEQYEGSLNGLRIAFSKFDAICQSMNPAAEEGGMNDTETVQVSNDETEPVEG